MIFAVHDWMGGKEPRFAGVQIKHVQWKTQAGTKKKPVIEDHEADVPCLEFDTLDQLFEFMKRESVIVQIRPASIDANGVGFPFPYLYTDTPSGRFHQR